MSAWIKTPEQKFVAVAGILGILVTFLTIYDAQSYNTTTFVDAVPPEEFLAGPPVSRTPSAAHLSAPEILSTRKKFGLLTRQEKRALYNAVIYYCNEERDDRVCGAYVGYCGKPCRMLMQQPTASRGNF